MGGAAADGRPASFYDVKLQHKRRRREREIIIHNIQLHSSWWESLKSVSLSLPPSFFYIYV
jgi:hypothetical protein